MDLGPDDVGKGARTYAISEVDVSSKAPTRLFHAGFYLTAATRLPLAGNYISVTSDISHDTVARSLRSRDGRGVRPYTIRATGFAG